MKKTFSIAADSIVEFAELLAEKELANEITGTDDDGDILVNVTYSSSQRYDVFELTEWVENMELEEEED